jgi:L-seryl-tRNA(Ser) seleniumtransferase
MQEVLRKLPSVDHLLSHPDMLEAVVVEGRSLVKAEVREALSQARKAILSGAPCPSTESLLASVRVRIGSVTRPTLREVINATGVIIHTNLGRAPLSEASRQAMLAAGGGYSNLEYDLGAGRRGSRYHHAEDMICRLTGAEAALVVNNNAGAVLLALTTLASGREAVISRGQLIEIGGGFRIPDVLMQSGARLVEVGTTNRTYVRDFEAAIGPATSLLLSAHRSNFRVAGFAEEVKLEELVELGKRHGLPVVNDLGSGTLLDTAGFGLLPEPTVQYSVRAGASVTTFSGDKLLGGPQSGIVVGQDLLVRQMRRHPLTRALRVDKTTLAGLQATLLHYLREEALSRIPVWQMIAMPLEDIRALATAWADELAAAGIPAGVREGVSTVGGGSLPGQSLPTALVAVDAPSPSRLADQLRSEDPAVVGRVDDGRLVFDPRTVQAKGGAQLVKAVRQAWQAIA